MKPIVKRFWLFTEGSPDPEFFNSVEEANAKAIQTTNGTTILEKLDSSKFIIATSSLISNTPKTLKELGIDA